MRQELRSAATFTVHVVRRWLVDRDGDGGLSWCLGGRLSWCLGWFLGRSLGRCLGSSLSGSFSSSLSRGLSRGLCGGLSSGLSGSLGRFGLCRSASRRLSTGGSIPSGLKIIFRYLTPTAHQYMSYPLSDGDVGGGNTVATHARVENADERILLATKSLQHKCQF